jgi:hypothetical protein
MRGIVGRGGLGRALVNGSLAGCLLGAHGTGAGASDFGRVPRPMPTRTTLEDRIPDLKRAREGARERLGDPQCLAVLTDFDSVNGGRLDLVLRSTGRTAQEQIDRLVVESGLGRPGCSRGQLAYTRIGSPVVSICLGPFTLLPAARQDAILIHEMLHSLGLGENPPESVAITERVLKRCVH